MDQPVRKSYLGTPIMSNVRFTAPQADFLVPGFENWFSNYPRIELNDVMCEVRQSKQIVKTELVKPQGYPSSDRNSPSDRRTLSFEGTVKEYISMGDYMITLRGKMVSEEDMAPSDKLVLLLKYLEYPGSFQISGKFFNPFDFSQVVVDNFRIDETRFLNEYTFVIQLMSDNYVSIKYESVQEGTLIT